jgi:hypothetical protein
MIGRMITDGGFIITQNSVSFNIAGDELRAAAQNPVFSLRELSLLKMCLFIESASD